MDFKTIILCGGSGTRLWPLSRINKPKQFINFKHEQTLLDMTLERVKAFKNTDPPLIISNNDYKSLVLAAVKKANLKSELIFEPIGKNTAAAIYTSTKTSPEDKTYLIISSDHLINDKNGFIQQLQNIYEKINISNWLIFGIKPNFPATYYGYFKVSKNSNNTFEKIQNFKEKPNQKIADTYFQNDLYFWNSGIYFVKNSTIKNSFKRLAPEISSEIDKAWENAIYDAENNAYTFNIKDFSKLKNMSIDTAIFEKSSNLFFTELSVDWSDIGSWDTFFEKSNIKNSQNIFQVNSKNNYIYPGERIITTIGIENLIIVDTVDATLIMEKTETQKVKQIVDQLKKHQRSEIFENSVDQRPWGTFKSLMENKHTKVKQLTIRPHSALSTQYHLYRSEHWVIVSGIADIEIDNKKFQLRAGNSIDIPQKAVHSVKNNQPTDLIIIEVQMGSYFGEDDIIRIFDPYKRNEK